jgi:hypothetical protein
MTSSTKVRKANKVATKLQQKPVFMWGGIQAQITRQALEFDQENSNTFCKDIRKEESPH